MAIQADVKSSRLQLKFAVGTDGEGKEILKASNVGSLKEGAGDDAVFQVAGALEGLQENPLRQVTKITETVLSEI